MTPRVLAVFLRGHLRLIAAGLTPRGRKSDYLRKASEITGKPYRRGEYAVAVADLTAFIKETVE